MNFKWIKVRFGQLRAKLRNYQFECFQNRVNIQISKLPEPERIIWLANKLLNEVQAQGHNIIIPGTNSTTLDIDYYTNPEIFKVENICSKFKVTGKRDLTV